jgi:VIT1/CCC1 family predicted Fe2+/Mn2+ transporter
VLSTFPLVIPFLVVSNVRVALRASNAIAIVMLFVIGWSLGRHAARPGWLIGLVLLAVGIALVAIIRALGG